LIILRSFFLRFSGKTYVFLYLFKKKILLFVCFFVISVKYYYRVRFFEIFLLYAVFNVLWWA